ncbi:MFS transporter [Microlunatus parietis]|uniref:Putative MFS family arabinose efflux permease n=1 Tax=Microlunatus parietis TaxID=682979 RepID=A0A7Y9LBT1_9ACTN|nr:MFS transporter [Microlunatus parietis]NYE74144.1 putative MFS family arabinose efflux permease [Microlunatus parietis]
MKPAAMVGNEPVGAPRPLPDRRIAATIWPLLVCAVIGLVPFTVFSTFLVQIAADAGSDTATVGTLRGLGGIAALLIGVLLAPLIDRWSRLRVRTVALAVLAVSCLVGAVGSYPTLIVFCLGVGAATAALSPVLLALAADRFSDAASSGRAATMITAGQTIAAIMAGPLVGLLALWPGWRGALVLTAIIALLLVAGSLARNPWTSSGKRRGDALTGLALRSVLRDRTVAGLIIIAFLRTAAFMGQLAFLAAFYHDRFGLDVAQFALVWTVSGVSFFLGNFLAGRTLARLPGDAAKPLLIIALIAATGALALIFTAPTLVVAIAGTAATAICHAVIAAAVVDQLVKRASRRAPTLALNAAGMSLGVFAGATVGGAGLALAGYPGLLIGLGALTAIGTLVAVGCLDSRTASVPATG